jgi:hypothetical protein
MHSIISPLHPTFLHARGEGVPLAGVQVTAVDAETQETPRATTRATANFASSCARSDIVPTEKVQSAQLEVQRLSVAVPRAA